MLYQAPPNAQLAYIVQTPGTDLWFSATNLHQLGSIDMSGKVTMHSLGSPGVKPTAIASGATPFDPSIWFVDSASDSIGAFSPDGVKEYQSPSGHVGIQQLASGPGEVWFSEQAANAIAKLDAQTGKIVEFPLPKTGQGAQCGWQCPEGLVSAGDIWFAESQLGSGSKIGRMGRDGQLKAEYPVPGGNPWRLTAGRDGTLWFTEASSPKIGRIDSTGKVTEVSFSGSRSANDITMRSDSTIWFTAGTGLPGEKPQIGEIRPDGSLTMFSLPLPDNAVPLGLTFRETNLRDDNHLYFVAGDQVWRMTPPS